MRTSEAGMDIIKTFEGLKLTAYQDSVGIWTIGYGHTLGVKEGDVITLPQANYNLAADVENVEEYLNKWLGDHECKQGEFDALVDFGFNLGIGALKQMLAHPWDEIPAWLLKWNKVRIKGVLTPSAGLTRRREAERTLFLSQPASDATS